ncbi:MAG: amidohydrolase family protein, partial [Actinomycetota bacterium]|nr:amidohydrolase family protein [Actinomycetota bacterium]
MSLTPPAVSAEPAASTEPGSRLWIRHPLAAFTGNSLDASGGIVVAGGKIQEVLSAGGRPSAPCDETFDAGSHVLLPGLINTHHHFYQSLTRAWGPVANAPLFPWLQHLYPIWARLKPRDLELAATAALAELLLSGCTTAADHHYVFPAGME